jgi:hypothetical protein
MGRYPKANFRVYAVWYNMFQGDSRERWPARLMTDPRVVHIWDEGRVIGGFYTTIKPAIQDKLSADSSDFQGPVMWDAYYLYGKTARWTGTAPTGLIRWGHTILQSSQSLVRELNIQLGATP